MKSLARIVGVVLALVLAAGPHAAASGTVLSLKSGGGAGTLGIEAELPLSQQSALVLTAGVAPGKAAVGLGGAAGYRYFFKRSGSRGFLTPYLGIAAAMDPQTGFGLGLPWYGAAVGYEWALSDRFRLAGEAGLGLLVVVPVPLLAVSAGYRL